ncbi:MAG: protein-L-isoaspartate(D-aspartate) O-methyltransferase [Deltaproteobacteria bacterium]|nr:protein-L-isoaspartate(D-aspartate) O-methyltransferase [Deltaproteobacteria bacterium]
MSFEKQRLRMVESQIVARGIKDPRVIDAMKRVPRHLFTDEALRTRAYDDSPLPIGEKQTISQPYMVAVMSEALELTGTEAVLEVGTGSAYQTAVLSCLARQVFSIERLGIFVDRARKILESLDIKNVTLKTGDGSRGWRTKAPFDAILVTAGSPRVPQPLVEQLVPGGRLVIPVGDRANQALLRLRKSADGGTTTEELVGCRFVDLQGAFGWPD